MIVDETAKTVLELEPDLLLDFHIGSYDLGVNCNSSHLQRFARLWLLLPEIERVLTIDATMSDGSYEELLDKLKELKQ